MSKKILVSVISVQTLPNYLFIKEFQAKIDKYIFITTKEMEEKNKTNLICQTAGIEEKNRNIILIKEDVLLSNVEQLKKLNLSNQDTFLVNLTGGTKMMAITVWQFFQKFENSRFFYIPIGRNTYQEVYENKEAEETFFTSKLTVKEYLKIYGINLEEEKLIFNNEEVNNIFNDVKSTKFKLDKFPRKKLKKLLIPSSNKQIHTKWFEEYLFYKIKKTLNINDDAIKTGIKLFEISEQKKKNYYPNDNELDIFFIYRNNPFLVEAKFNIGKEKINTTALNNYIFKLSAVNKRFGLKAKATIMTLSSFENMSEESIQNLERRCKISNICFPIDQKQITNNFQSTLKNFVK